MAKKKNITLTEFFDLQPRGAQSAMAEALQTTTQYLNEIKNGRRTCSPNFAQRIEQYTEGKGLEVRAATILGLETA